MSTTIERIIDELRLEWNPGHREAFRIEPEDIAGWKERAGLDEAIMLDTMGMSLARRFHDAGLEFWFCNDVVNDVWHYLLAADHLRDASPTTFCEVFYAFEAGEVDMATGQDPIEFLVRPLIAKLLGITN